MEKKLKVWKCLLAVVLCFLLGAGMLPASALAAQDETTAAVTREQTVTDATQSKDTQTDNTQLANHQADVAQSEGEQMDMIQSSEEQTDSIQSATGQTDQGVLSVSLRNPRIVEDSSMTAGQKVTWDCVWFGSYPQSEVTSSDSVYSELTSATEWDSNNEITLNDGTKYRRMKKGDATYAMSESDGYYNWSDNTTYHYFKYEPIKWRVLEVSEGKALLVADIALDDQQYNSSFTSVTWDMSSMRSWLNGYDASNNQPEIDYTSKNFIDSAFTLEEQAAIETTNVENKDNLSYGTEGGNDTNDKVFLLSESDGYSDSATSHGFVSDEAAYDEARRCKSSTYAKAMGTWSSTSTTYKGNCYWWLRSPGSYTSYATCVDMYGCGISRGCSVHSDDDGVRPALNLNLSYSDFYTCAGIVCSDDMSNEHDFKESKRQEPTCTEDGFVEYECSICGVTKTETIEALGHDFEEQSRTEPTCMEDGSIVQKCTRCGATETTSIPATKNISTCSVTLSKTSYTYDGKEKKPTVTLKDGSNVVPKDAYEISYTNNIQAGTATATVTGQNGYTGTARATFTIQPKAVTYVITYNANGGNGAPATQTKKKNTSLKLSTAKPTKKGYTFQGWATSKSSTKVAYKAGATISAKTNKNMTLYAVWKANTYKVAFHKNGGTGSMATVTYTYGKSYTLKANAFKRTGYTFQGWNKKADGSDKTTYANKATVKNLSSVNGKTITLYAQWKIKTYKITYKLNSGTNNKSNPSSYKVTTKTIILKNPTRKGYKFKGWYTSSSFQSSTKVTKITKGSTGNKTLYAKWSKK